MFERMKEGFGGGGWRPFAQKVACATLFIDKKWAEDAMGVPLM